MITMIITQLPFQLLCEIYCRIRTKYFSVSKLYFLLRVVLKEIILRSLFAQNILIVFDKILTSLNMGVIILFLSKSKSKSFIRIVVLPPFFFMSCRHTHFRYLKNKTTQSIIEA